MPTMSLPIIAIVGRPNVGKSRLFNRLVGRYRALVDDMPGVTRDRHYGTVSWGRNTFLLIDTGGIIPGSEEPLNKKVWQQAFLAIQEADLVLCVFDVHEGISPIDEALDAELRKIKKPVIYAGNKSDSDRLNIFANEFSRMGLEAIPVSAEHGRGIGDLLDAITAKIPYVEEEVKRGEGLHLSIIGRPNVGKSTLINQ